MNEEGKDGREIPENEASAGEAFERSKRTYRRFQRLLEAGKPWVTLSLIGLNILAFIYQNHLAAILKPEILLSLKPDQASLAGQIAQSESVRILGANSRDLVLGQGQWWRLVACMFLHFGVLHLAVNMMSLYSLGSLLEKLAGPWRFLGLYFLAGLCGSLVGLLNSLGMPSVGASGAIFGLAGALMALRWRRPVEFPKALAIQVFRSLLKPTLIIFGLGIGLQVAYWLGLRLFLFDNWAHFGGLSSGFGMILLWPLKSKRPRRSF